MHRILFSIGNFPIYSYGVCIALGVLLGYIMVNARNKRLKIGKNEDISDLFLYMLIFGILGARILYIFLHTNEYMSDPLSAFNLRAGGLSLYGSLIAGFCVLIYFSKKRKLDPFKVIDLFAPAVLLGIAVGRIGCFLNACCIGVEAPAPWGVVFADAGFTTPRYPAPLYEMVLDLIAMGFILYSEKHKKFEGELMLSALCYYSVIRFIIEFFRDNHLDNLSDYGLSLAQYFCIAVVLFLSVLIFKARSKGSINILENETKKSVKKK